MSNLQKSKRYVLIDILTTPLDILTIYSPSMILNLRNIVLIYIQRNFSWTKQIIQTKLLAVMFIPAFTTNAMTSGFPIVNFPWLSGHVPRLPSYCVYISQLVRFARCCTSVSDFNSKNLLLTSKILTQGSKNIRKVLQVKLWPVVQIYRFKNMLRKESLTRSSTVSSLQTKEGQMWSEFRLVGL